MKISKSKQELARIISENGGWRDGAEWAALEQQGGDVWLCAIKPLWCVGVGIFSFKDHVKTIPGSYKLPNIHQAILSREEYFHLYPAPDADGWIEWKGGECPVANGTMLDLRHRDGELTAGVSAGVMRNLGERDASCSYWANDNYEGDIIAYRLHKPGRAKPTAVGDDETNIAAKEELEAMEYKPSIEQLMQTYANRAHSVQLANEHLATCTKQANEAMGSLSVACKAAGFDISPITAKKEPELVIADWRDLRVGDEVEAVVPNGGEVTTGELGVIVKSSHNGFWCNFPSQKFYWYYNTHFELGDVKFIRRP